MLRDITYAILFWIAAAVAFELVLRVGEAGSWSSFITGNMPETETVEWC